MSHDRKFRPLQAGTVIGGCKVTARLNEGTSAKNQRYRVTYQCCGRAREIAHINLVQRRSLGYERCAQCGSQHQRGRPRPARHHPNVKQTALEMREAGFSYARIGKALGISRWTVRDWYEKRG